MTDINKLFNQYQALQRSISKNEELLHGKNTESSELEKNLTLEKSGLNKTETALRDAVFTEIEGQKELLTKADGMLKEGNFKEAYILITGKTLQEAVRHVLMPQIGTYAKGVHALREACKAEGNSVHPTFTRDDGSQIYCPLTFKENIEARVNDYETLENPDGSERTKEERLKLLNIWLDSCAGIANKKESTKFKIVPVCKELILIDKNFNQFYLPVNYELVDGVELDSKKGKYNKPLTKPEVLEHPGWREAVEEDKKLLETYRDIVFAEKGNPNKLMGFYVGSKTNSDQLRALCVGNLGYDSNADGRYYFNDDGSFLRVAQ
jgi:hypothetical protein